MQSYHKNSYTSSEIISTHLFTHLLENSRWLWLIDREMRGEILQHYEDTVM